MDPMFLPYSPVNGVPQESKLATYMKRQSNAAVANSLAKNLTTLNLSDANSIKKIVAQGPEYNLRSSPALSAYSSTSPINVHNHSNTSPITTVPAYQKYVGGTTYFYSTPEPVQNPAPIGNSSRLVSTPVDNALNNPGNDIEPNAIRQPTATLYPGTSSHTKSAISKLYQQMKLMNDTNEVPVLNSYFVNDDLRLEIQRKNNVTLAGQDPGLHQDLPVEVDNYHDLVPLESQPSPPKPILIPYSTSTYKATHSKTGIRYCLKRVHGFRLPNSKCMTLVDTWKSLTHSNVVQLREVFTTKTFGDHSIVFVYDFHPDSETLLARHFTNSDLLNGYSDSFSSNPNAPRPYSHSKNHLLRQQHTNGMLSEAKIWSYIIQLTAAMAVVHALGLSCRCIDLSKIILTGKHRIRLSAPAIMDVVNSDSMSNPQSLMHIYQQEDMTALGKLVLALACKSLIAVQRENVQTSVELMSRNYSTDLRNLVMYLLSSKSVRTVVDLMPMIGARYYTQLEAVQYENDMLTSELAKEIENGRLMRLMVKLGTINERPEVNMDPSWSETGDRYMIKLFRDHLFHQVTEDGRPFLDMAHIINCLNKLDSGTHEKVCLMSRDEQSVLVVTYAELKHCLEQSFADLVASAKQE